MSFENLKTNNDQIQKLLNAAQEAGGGKVEKKDYNDDRFWKPTVDKAGNGYAALRFLPAPEGNELPWVRYWDHGFKGPTGMWYIEKSLTSIGQQDPVSEMNTKLWNSGREEDKQIVRERKRRLHYVSNVYVVSDPSAPQNEGKVFLYTFGKKIFDKIMDIMQPQFPGEQPVNPFDFWGGADFQLKIRQVEGYRNYDKSEFRSPEPFKGGDDEQLKGVYNTLYDLKEFTDPKNYKTYEELKVKLANVLGEAMPRTTQQTVALDETAPAPQPKAAESVDNDDEDTMSYFARLAAED
jgi:hypothetical protein